MNLFEDILAQPHTLIAGKTGSGKSVVVNGVMKEILQKSPSMVQLILIDPKMTELSFFKNIEHTITYANEANLYAGALTQALQIIKSRCAYMEEQRLRMYDGGDVYVIIDELADIMTDNKTKAECAPLIQRIGQIGRSSKVHLVMCTQCPLAEVIPTRIKCNMNMLGLKTRCAQDSRNIIGRKGCESLPDHGLGIYVTPTYDDYVTIPYVTDSELLPLIDRWEKRSGSAPAAQQTSRPQAHAPAAKQGRKKHSKLWNALHFFEGY